MAGTGLSRLCFNDAVQKSMKALENYTIKSLTPSHSKTLYSVLYGVLCAQKNVAASCQVRLTSSSLELLDYDLAYAQREIIIK